MFTGLTGAVRDTCCKIEALLAELTRLCWQTSNGGARQAAKLADVPKSTFQGRRERHEARSPLSGTEAAQGPWRSAVKQWTEGGREGLPSSAIQVTQTILSIGAYICRQPHPVVCTVVCTRLFIHSRICLI